MRPLRLCSKSATPRSCDDGSDVLRKNSRVIVNFDLMRGTSIDLPTYICFHTWIPHQRHEERSAFPASAAAVHIATVAFHPCGFAYSEG
jgi:hypothetical protein